LIADLSGRAESRRLCLPLVAQYPKQIACGRMRAGVTWTIARLDRAIQ
jgi:hypothetical protein